MNAEVGLGPIAATAPQNWSTPRHPSCKGRDDVAGLSPTSAMSVDKTCPVERQIRQPVASDATAMGIAHVRAWQAAYRPTPTIGDRASADMHARCRGSSRPEVLGVDGKELPASGDAFELVFTTGGECD